jgi:hypothetical protein
VHPSFRWSAVAISFTDLILAIQEDVSAAGYGQK